MKKLELEALLEELDEALVKAFPGPEPMSVLMVGGACLIFQGVTDRSTEDVDVIIFEMMGSEESTLIFNAPIADKIRRIIKSIGRRHGLRGKQQIDRKSTRLNSSHRCISYAVFCLKKKKENIQSS